MHRQIVPALLAAALTASAGAPAVAQPADAASATVRVADLNLNTDAGARAALGRIRQTAGKVCGGEPDSRLLDRRALYDVCVRDAVDRTVASADSPRLTALNRGEAKETKLASVR